MEHLPEVIRFLETLSKDKFFGEIVLQFQHGNLVLIRRIETISPGSLNGKEKEKYKVKR